jgi:hypothetical protein
LDTSNSLSVFAIDANFLDEKNSTPAVTIGTSEANNKVLLFMLNISLVRN